MYIAMKKTLIFLFFIFLAECLPAQIIDDGWQQRQDLGWMDGHAYIYGMAPFNAATGYSLYGSSYRKAKQSKNWGIFLSCVVAPAGALLMVYGIEEGPAVKAIVGGAALAGGLGAGIPLWKKGRRQLDWMLDDYVERYGPGSFGSSVTVGPTMNGVGLALNF